VVGWGGGGGARKGDADGVMAKGGRDALLVGWCVSVWGGAGWSWWCVGGARDGLGRGGCGGDARGKGEKGRGVELVVRECVCARLVFFMRELFGLCFLCACSLFLFLF